MKTIKIGTATLIHGDCEEFMKDLPDKFFDLAVTDPPYFDGPQKAGYYAGTKQKTEVGEYKDLSDTWEIPGKDYFDRLVALSNNQIIWGINYYDFAAPGGRIVWVKGSQGSPFSMAEIAYQSFYNRVDLFSYLWSGFWQEPGNKKEIRIHPTQKPVKLYEWIYANYAKPGQTILDTHGGSMSSVIAALNMGFEITCIEKDKDYFNAAVERVIKSQQQQKLF